MSNRLTEATVSTADVKAGKLGTFAGVFTPSILTILGLILFLRMGYVVGNAGLANALAILAISTAISILTSTSLSAIATNLRVKGGGDYYLISRTLGAGFGGALGSVLFLAQSVSIAFYCIGFAEAVCMTAGWEHDPSVQLIAVAAVAFLFVFAWLGADWATRFQYVVMAVLTLALVSFFWGASAEANMAQLTANWSSAGDSAPGFWVLFAIFFPAVTGFTQGVSMSGDLKDPARSLPTGTFWAVGISTVIYLAVAILLAASLPGEVLSVGGSAMEQVAGVGWLITAGIVVATLSSGMASFLGAPRILQSLARDRIFGVLAPFAVGHGPSANPRRAVLLSAGIALLTIAAGDLNVVASVVSMFFLISYGLLNYATFYEASTSSPAFRPRFRWYHPKLSLAAAIACLVAMVAINTAAAIVAGAFLLALYQYLTRKAGQVGFHDSRRANAFQRVREHLHDMASAPNHPRDWRPQLLVLSDSAHRRHRLLRFASWIEGGSGTATAVRIITGSGPIARQRAAEAERELAADVASHGVDAFSLAISTPDLQTGLDVLLQSYGVGPLRANIVLFNWLDRSQSNSQGSESRFGQPLHTVLRHRRNIIILDADDASWERCTAAKDPRGRRVDVWWWGGPSSHLVLLLAYLMTRRKPWQDATIRVLAPVADGTTTQATLTEVQSTLDDVRIAASVEAIPDASGATIAQRSADASLVFLPIKLHQGHLELRLKSEITLADLLNGLPVTAMCIAGEEFDLDAEPDEGIRAERAAAAEKLARARNRLMSAEAEAAEAARIAKIKSMEFEDALLKGGGLDAIAAAVAAAHRAAQDAAEDARRVAKAIAKTTVAMQDAKELGVAATSPKPDTQTSTGKPKQGDQSPPQSSK